MRDVLRPVYRADESHTFGKWATVAAVLRDNSWAKLKQLNKDLKLIPAGNVYGCKSTMKDVQVLQEILNLPEVLQLDLRGCLPSEAPRQEMLIALRTLKHVQTLILQDCSIISEECEQIFTDSDHTTLTSLDLSHNSIAVDAKLWSDMSGIEALAKYVENNSKLTKLVLSYNEIGDNGAIALGEALKKNESLTDLNLNNCGIGEEGGTALKAALDKAVLTECSLLKNELDVESATMLANIGTEKRIMLSGMKQDQTTADFSEQMLSPADAILIASDLPFMAVLKKLVLSENSIEDEGAIALGEALKKNKSLTRLYLNNCGIGTEGGTALAAALGKAVLKKLVLSENRMEDGAIAIGESLKTNSTLEELELINCEIRAAGGIAIGVGLQTGMAVLKKLVLSENRIGDEGAIAIGKAVEKNENLKELELASCRIDVRGGKAFAAALSKSAVTHLDLSINILTHYGNDMSGIQEIAKALKALKPGMAQCWLLNNNIDVETATTLAEIGRKKNIMLSGIKTDQTEADFGGKDLRPADAILIASDLPSMALTSLDLTSNSLCGLNIAGYGTYEPSGIQALASALDNAVLNKLVLSINNIKDEGASALGEALKVNKSLKELELYRCEIGPHGGKALAAALSEGTAVLTSLDISSNQLCGLDYNGNGTYDPSGIQALAAALSSGSAVLTNLNLEFNKIGPEGAKALADALQSGKAVLTTLDLSRNKLCGIDHRGQGTYDPTGIQALAAALGTAVLKELALSYNNIGDEGATAIGNALKTNSTLEELRLINCEIGPGGKELAAALSQGAAVLTNLDVRYNSLTNEDKDVLQQAASGRTGFTLFVFG